MSFQKSLKSAVKTRILTRLPIRTRWTPPAGPPEGLELKELEELCMRRLGRPPVRVCHEHLSGWKSSGAYRVHVSCGWGRSWSLVYKRAQYGVEQTPALDGLPFSPGPPEYLVYSQGENLGVHLAETFAHHEDVPGKLYRYLFEDLGHRYLRGLDLIVREPDLVVRLAGDLPALHRDLRDWPQATSLPEYGAAFREALPRYLRKNLNPYLDELAANKSEPDNRELDSWLPEFRRLLEEMLSAYGDRVPAAGQELVPIHGDYHVANIFLDREGRTLPKLVDWEWAGLGRAHMDLASLLKLASGEIERRALQAYGKAEDSLGPIEHQQRYAWCKMERFLIDAAFYAAQEMRAPVRARFSLRESIAIAAQRSMDAYRSLRPGT